MKHISSLHDDDESLRGFHGLCCDRLKEFGICTSTLFQKPKSEQFQTTPNKTASKPKPKQNVFGIDLKDLLPSAVIIDPENQLQVPHFLKATLNYLQDHLDTEGLFRKAGSKRNQRILRNEIEEAESFCIDTSDQGNLLRDIKNKPVRSFEQNRTIL